MGREIRRVPPGWAHPTDRRGNPIPMYDRVLADEQAAWDEAERDWRRGEDPNYTEYPNYADWAGERPDDAESYRPAWEPDEATAFQVYETVTEGTPCSPVFGTRDALVAWLSDPRRTEFVDEIAIMTRAGAERFAEMGWAPSMVLSPTHGIRMGTQAIDEGVI
jgi:hypothetical protein